MQRKDRRARDRRCVHGTCYHRHRVIELSSMQRTLVHRKNIEETATRYRQLRVVGTAPIALRNGRNVNFREIDFHEGKWLASMSVNRA